MAKSSDLYKKLRRDFLKRVALAGGTAAIGVPAARLVAAEPAPAQDPPRRDRGYHETPHIRKYYEKART